MKPSKFNEAQIIDILREAAAGAKAADLYRRHGISNFAFYAWKAKFGGMTLLLKSLLEWRYADLLVATQRH